MKLRAAEALDLSTSLIWIDDEPFSECGLDQRCNIRHRHRLYGLKWWPNPENSQNVVGLLCPQYVPGLALA